MNTARASPSVLSPQCSCCKWGHPRSLEVTRGHQSPAWAQVVRGPEADNTHDPSSGRALGYLRTEPGPRQPPSALSLSLSSPGPRSGGCCPQCPGWATAAGQMSRRGQRLVSPGRERSALVTRTQTQSGVRHRRSSHWASLHCIIVTLSRITQPSSAHHYSLSLSHLNQESFT